MMEASKITVLDNFEIISNIYENQELVKEATDA